MPRQARIDLPKQIYHVLSRGIERREIFYGPEDYLDFRNRMVTWLTATRSTCLAWCLMPNHFHFLLQRGERPLSELMHRVMTGYAVSFNIRHHRVGHLFQNRYKAILCSTESQLVESAAYIHLNPLRAKLVQNLDELETFKWCGHRCAVSEFEDGLLNRDLLLSHFGDGKSSALAQYKLKIIERQTGEDKDEELEAEALAITHPSNNTQLDAETDFSMPEPQPIDRMEALNDAERISGISRQDILRHTRSRGPAKARALYCHLAHEKAGTRVIELAQELGLTESAVSKLILRGRDIERLAVANSPIVKNVP